MWDPFLMKKLIKNKICGFVNSAYIYCSLQKVNICGYCLLNSNCNTPKRVKKKKKKKKKGTKRSWKCRLGIQTRTQYRTRILSEIKYCNIFCKLVNGKYKYKGYKDERNLAKKKKHPFQFLMKMPATPTCCLALAGGFFN